MTDYTPLAPPIATPIYREDGTISNVWNEYFVRYGLMINSAVDGVEIYGENVFKYSAGETIPDNTSITLTALLLGNLTVYDWEYYNGTAWTDLSGTQDEITYTLAYDNAAWGSNTFLRVRCLSGTAYGETTILKMYDGVAGVDGGNWSSDINFVAADYNTVGWYAGSIFTAGVEFEIVQNLAGTGNMAATTAYYIYLYPTASITELQVTTSAVDAVGSGKILVAVAYPNASTSVKAQFQAFGGRGGVFINADNIAAGCITADKLVANSITTGQLNFSPYVLGVNTYSNITGGPPVGANQTYISGNSIYGVSSGAGTEIANSALTSSISTAATTANFSSISDTGGTLTISSAKLVINTSNGIEVNNGADIVFKGNDTNAGLTVFTGTSYNHYFGGNTTGSRITIWPSSSNLTTFAIGYNHTTAVQFANCYINAATTYIGGQTYAGSLLPTTNNTYVVGNSIYKWASVWAVDGTINTSDEKDKKDIVGSDLGLDFVKELIPKKWLWNTGVRPHYGLVAQDVETVMQSKNIDFAGLIKNNLSKVKRDKEDDKTGKIKKEEILIETKDIKPGDELVDSYDAYGLRYHEFIGPMIKAIQELSNKVDTLTPTQTEKEI